MKRLLFLLPFLSISLHAASKQPYFKIPCEGLSRRACAGLNNNFQNIDSFLLNVDKIRWDNWYVSTITVANSITIPHPRFQVYRNAAFNWTTTDALLIMDMVPTNGNPNSLYNTTTGSATITTAGWYAMGAQVCSSSLGDGTRGIVSILVNGTSVANGIAVPGGATDICASTHKELPLAVGDVLAVHIVNNLGTQTGNAGNANTFFYLRMVTPL